MTFATETAKPNSERFALVKITPARYVSTQLSAAGGGVYDMAWTYPINRIERNGVALTETTSTPGTNDYWYWDGTTVEIKLAAAPSATNVIVIFYDLFYTSEKYRITTTDPEDSATAERHWEPRLDQLPRVKQNVSDIINGVISSAITNISIINTGHDFENYLTDNDSFYQKTVKVWFCANGVGNIQKIYEGRCQSVSISGDTVSLQLFDAFAKLDQPALFGDAAGEAYWLRETGSFPDLLPREHGTPIRMVLGPTTRYSQYAYTTHNSIQLYQVLAGDLERAVCTNYDPNLSTSVNKIWGIARFNSSGPRSLSFGTVQEIYCEAAGGGANWTMTAYVRITGTHNLRVGDTFVAGRNSDAFEVYCVVRRDTEFNFNDGGGTDTYQYILEFNATSDLSANFTAANYTFESHDAPALFRIDINSPANAATVYRYKTDYLSTNVALDSGNVYQYITLTAGSSTTDPSNLEIVWRHGAEDGYLHGEVVSDLATGAGLSVNAASISAANSALAVNTAFTIPQFDETEFSSYRKYLELICQSTMGIAYFNNSFELVYSLLSTPSSTSSYSDDAFNGISVTVDYKDIVTQLVAYNPHNSNENALDAATSPSETVSSDVALYLHETRNVVRFRHVLETITGRIQDIFDILSNRRAIYRFTTSSADLAAAIGDDLQLDADEVLGGSGSVDLKIVGLDKSPDSVDIEATDLLDI